MGSFGSSEVLRMELSSHICNFLKIPRIVCNTIWWLFIDFMLNRVIFFIRRYSRETPFTALNVDVRNHHTLIDSLEQYVKGDLLEGANAYHCERCDKKVALVLCLGAFFIDIAY